MRAVFAPSGVITLTTDFGHKGPFVASMKGVMMTRFPAVRVVDLTHEIYVHWPAEAGFWLERAYRFFPTGTVHVAVVDPGVGTERHILVAEHDGHAFVAPDNGLLMSVLGPASVVHTVDLAKLGKLALPTPSITFQGRDIFAPLAAELAAGRARATDFGPRATDLVPSWVDDAEAVAGQIRGTIISVDHFGNLITNIRGEMLDTFSAPEVLVGGHTIPIRRTYAEGRPGDYLALINSFGVLEVARAEKSASDGLSAHRGAPVQVREQPSTSTSEAEP